jgi:sialic acid synthase SpsE
MRPADPYLIAEAGANHNGSLDEALRLVELARRSGADSVKFQIIDPDELYLPGNYQYGHYDVREVVAMRRRFVLPDDAYRRLADRARELGLDFSASVFDRHGLELLCSLHPAYVKIASTDLNNVRFLRQVAEKGVTMILSTGMSSLQEIECSVREVLRTGFQIGRASCRERVS